MDKEDVGIAAIEEWEAGKRQRGNRLANRAGNQHNQHRRTLRSHRREVTAPRTDRSSSPAIGEEAQHTPRIPRHRYSRIRIIPSSSQSVEIPETQQEVLPNRSNFAVEISRPIGFYSQNYPTAPNSQVERNSATQDTANSKDNTEGDSTLGSSIPPDSPIRSTAGRIADPESLTQVLLSYPRTNPLSEHNSLASVPKYPIALSSGVEVSPAGHELQSGRQGLLVVRSDPVSDTVRSLVAEHPADHTNSSPPVSPLFYTDEGELDLQPIIDPNRVEEESGTEGELEFLSSFSSSVSKTYHQSVQPGTTRPHPNSARLRQSRVAKENQPSTPKTPCKQVEHEDTSQAIGNRTDRSHSTSALPFSTKSAQNSSPTSSRRFHFQPSPLGASVTLLESPRATSRVKSTHKPTVVVAHPSQVPSIPSSPTPISYVPTRRTSRLASSPPHSAFSPNHSVLTSQPNFPPIQPNMANSHRESSPRVRRPPNAPSEMAPEIGLREKLRQIRATSRANQNARSKNQANTGDSRSPTTSRLETRSLRRPSPEKDMEPLGATSTPAEDQPVPSLENVDGPVGDVEVEKADGESALNSSLGAPLPILNAPSAEDSMAVQDHEAEKTITNLDIPTMPLLQPSEFVVPLPIDGRIKHQYVAELAERYKEINDFLNSPKSPRLINAMVQMIRQLNDTVVHTDLGLNGPATQVVSTAEEALWAEDASSKFAFLGHLFSILHGSTHHIVLVARSGTTQNLLNSYLKGKGVTYRQYPGLDNVGASQEGAPDDRMMYTLLCTDKNSLKSIPRSASLIIAFDDSFEANMLPEWCATTRFVPVLLLLIVNSAEHVGRCIPQDIPQPERLRRLVKAVVHVQGELGEMPLQVDYRHAFNLDPGARLALVKKDLGAKIGHAATHVANALRSKNFALDFALQSISELDLAGLEDQPPSTEDSKEASLSASRAGTPAGQKRLRVSRLDGDDNVSDCYIG